MQHRSRLDALPTQGLKVDISPMIDLVFLLLIFFMVASTLITYRKDKNVVIPIAKDAKVPKQIEGRVIINVYEDGKIVSEMGKTLRLEDVERIMGEAKRKNPEARLHLRADKRAPHKKVKDVITASGKGGVVHVIFSTYVTSQ